MMPSSSMYWVISSMTERIVSSSAFVTVSPTEVVSRSKGNCSVVYNGCPGNRDSLSPERETGRSSYLGKNSKCVDVPRYLRDFYGNVRNVVNGYKGATYLSLVISRMSNWAKFSFKTVPLLMTEWCLQALSLRYCRPRWTGSPMRLRRARMTLSSSSKTIP
jgi:hypothetical protein